MRRLKISSAGAAQGLIGAVTRAFYGDERHIEANFGPVGAIADAIRKKAEADIVVLTKSVVSELADEGFVAGSSIVPLGVVRVGVAVRQADPNPSLASREDLQATLLTADAIFLPDPVKSTSGSHVMRVIDALGILDAVQPKLRVSGSGTAAMSALAAADLKGVAIGFTQATEIVDIHGIRLGGFLPGEFNLVTNYVAAISQNAIEFPLALDYLKYLSGSESAEIRNHAGFLLPQ